MAALIEAIDIKRKMFFEYENAPYHCLDVEVSKPTARGGQTLVRLKMRNLLTRAVFDGRSRPATSSRSPTSSDGAGVVPVRRRRRLSLHGPGDASRRSRSAPTCVGDDRQLLVDNVLVQIQKYNGSPIGLQLPPHVELTVTSTEPGVRGDTASGGVTKLGDARDRPEIRVPLFIKEGEKVKVHTETREFAGRA